MSDSNEPWRSRSSRTSRETRSWRHETPVQLHGLLVEFHVVSLFALSVEALNAKRGSKSGFFEAWEKRKWRMRRKKVKGRRTYRLGFAIVVCKFRVRERERERDMKGLYCDSQVGVTV